MAQLKTLNEYKLAVLDATTSFSIHPGQGFIDGLMNIWREENV